MVSIRQNVYPDVLPDFRNLGVPLYDPFQDVHVPA